MKIYANSAATANGVAGPLSRVFEPVQTQLDEVDRRITAQTAAFDPAIEGYVAYAIGGGGKRLRPLVAHCHFGLGKVYLQTSKRDEAREHFTSATTMYGEMDMQFWLTRAEVEMRGLA